MLTIKFRNDGTGDEETGNYDVSVLVNEHLIARERVEGHKRADGWRALLQKWLNDTHEGCGCYACRGL